MSNPSLVLKKANQILAIITEGAKPKPLPCIGINVSYMLAS